MGPVNLVPCLQPSSKTLVHGLRRMLWLRGFWRTRCCWLLLFFFLITIEQDTTQLLAAAYTRHVCLHPWSGIVPSLSPSLSGEASICQRDRLQSGLSHSLIYYVPALTAAIWGEGGGCTLIDCRRNVLDWPTDSVPSTAVCRHSARAGFALISLIKLSFTWDMAFLLAHPSFYLSLLDETAWNPFPHSPHPSFP